MKKNLVRILAFALVLILALGIIPLGAFADDLPAPVTPTYMNRYPLIKDGFPDSDKSYIDSRGTTKFYSSGSTIKSSDYANYVVIDGKGYDFIGFGNPNGEFMTKYKDFYNNNQNNPEALQKYYNSLINQVATFSKKDIKVEPFPTSENMEDVSAWFAKYGNILAGYVPHGHKLSRWYSDGTTHWRQCLVCKDNFMYQNWCQDGDEDEVCNVCGGHVPYHDITIIESEGGTITVNRDNASHRMKITADVETNDGYQFVKLHFTKVRPDGSKQEVVRYEKGGQFWTNMPTYPMEITAEFVKK